MNRTVVRNAIAALVVIVLGAIAAVVVSDFLSSDASLDAQLGRLHSAFAFRRRSAATELARFAPEAARIVPELLKACGDGDPEVRVNALTSLQEMGKLPVEALPVLTKVLKDDPDVACRRNAAACLGKLSDPGAESALVTAIDDPDPTVRLAAVNAIGALSGEGPSTTAIDRLSRVVKEDGSEELRQAGLQVLGIVVGQKEEVARTVAEVLAKDESPRVRNSAAVLLVKSKFDFQVPSLLAALDKDQSAQVRLTAAGGLVAIGMKDARIVPALCKALRGADDLTRTGLATHISNLRWDQLPGARDQVEKQYMDAARDLIALMDLDAPSAKADLVIPLVRAAAVYQQSCQPALLEPAKQALQSVLKLIEDEKENAGLRLSAINQWGSVQMHNTPPLPGARMKDEQGNDLDQLRARGVWLASLARSLNSANDDVATRAAELMLDAIRDRNAPSWYRDAWRQTVPQLMRAVRSAKPKVRGLSLAILAGLGPEAEEGLGTLREIAKEISEPGEREAAERAVKAIAAGDGLKSADPAIRAETATVLGGLGWHASRVLPGLISLLKDPDPKVRAAAATSLEKLGAVGKDSVASMVEAFALEADPAARVALLNAVASISPDSPTGITIILAALSDASPDVRRASVALKSFPATDAIAAALVHALDDGETEIRQGAARALTTLLYRNATVIPALMKAIKDKDRREAIFAALDDHFENTSPSADLGGPARNPAGSRALVQAAVPPILEALDSKEEGDSRRAILILGRLFGLARGNDADARAVLAGAIPRFLAAAESTDQETRQAVLDELGRIAVDRPAVIAMILKELGRSASDSGERTGLFRALSQQARSARTDPAVHAALVPAVPLLIRALDSPTQEVCEAAIAVLQSLGKDAAPAESKLREMSYQHPQPNTRQLAGDAAKEIANPGSLQRPSGGMRGMGGGAVAQ
ncbi:HEAT repeat domain-containing protein [Aquisphaera insulae]|uniref:HEAT repeat domain-containing protein n=1 Tax=Aquisphaera insulae TaxID=2712864 RepID=UPI0013EAAC7D|nr:HEAT repeat domain-containing protein [Aquisphaera insulae]